MFETKTGLSKRAGNRNASLVAEWCRERRRRSTTSVLNTVMAKLPTELSLTASGAVRMSACHGRWIQSAQIQRRYQPASAPAASRCHSSGDSSSYRSRPNRRCANKMAYSGR